MTSYLVYSTVVALKWNRKIRSGNFCSLPLFGVGTPFSHLFFSNTTSPASNKFWTKVQLSTKSDAFLLANILMSLIILFQPTVQYL